MYGHLAPRPLLDCQISCQESCTSVVLSCRLVRIFQPLACVRLCRVSTCSLTTLLTATMYSSRLKWDKALRPGSTPTWFPVHAQKSRVVCMQPLLGTFPLELRQLHMHSFSNSKNKHTKSLSSAPSIGFACRSSQNGRLIFGATRFPNTLGTNPTTGKRVI